MPSAKLSSTFRLFAVLGLPACALSNPREAKQGARSGSQQSPLCPLTRCNAASTMKRYREADALEYKPAGGQAANYVSKHKQRNKGLEIVFNPQDHK